MTINHVVVAFGRHISILFGRCDYDQHDENDRDLRRPFFRCVDGSGSNIAVTGLVGIAFSDQLLDHIDDLRHMLCRPRLLIRR